MVALRVAYVVHDRTFTVIPGAEMEIAAASLAREGVLGNFYGPTSGPSADMAPLYAVGLAALYKLFGWDTIAGRVAQETCAIAATTFTILLLPTVATRTGLSVTAAWMAALALAILPLNLWVETSGAWEQPYSALVLLWMLLACCKLHREEWRSRSAVVSFGASIGAAALLTPTLLPAAALMIAFEIRRSPNRNRILGVGLAVLVAAAILTPWTVRNYLVFDKFIPLRGNFGLALAIGHNPMADGSTFITSIDDPNNPTMAMHPFTSWEERQRLSAMGEANYMAARGQEAIDWIRANPGRTFELTLQRTRLFWLSPPELWAPSSPGRLVKAAIFSVIGLLALLALAILVVRGQDYAWLLVAAATGPSFLYLITSVDPRYRYPVFALTTLLACDLVVNTFAHWRWTKRPSSAA